MKQFYWIFQ